jgi:hypothetical protein
MVFFSLHVNKTIKSNREIINGFLDSFEYIKLKIGKEEEEEKRQNKKKKKESIKQETNCSSLQIDIVRINEIKGKPRTVQMKKEKQHHPIFIYTKRFFFSKHTQNLSHSKTKIQIEEESFFFFICSSY